MQSNWLRNLSGIALSSACAFLVACGGGSGSSTPPTGGSGASTVASLNGTVSDSATGAGLAGVQVSVGAVSATTSAAGTYSLAVGTGTLVVSFRKAGYVEQTKVNTDLMSSGSSSFLSVQLLPYAQTIVLSGTAAQTVTVAGSSAAVALPADGLRRPDGSPAQGAITVNLTPINPTSNINAMPGSLVTMVSGSSVPIESFGALNVTISDAAGAELNLRSGQSATIRIPAVTRGGALPAMIPLFHFNTTTGQWVQEGSASLVGSGVNAYYEGVVTHFSTWNADQVVNTTFINGCVRDAAGAPAAGARITSEGIDYNGSSSVISNAQGAFRIAVKTNSSVALTASLNGQAGSSAAIQTTTAEQTVTACLTLLAVGGNAGGVTIKLTWGASPSDLDSHLWAPDSAGIATEVYYSNTGSLASSPYANLDVDDTTSFGPEFVTISKMARNSTYRYWVENYSGTYNPGQTGSPARIEVNIGGNVTAFTPPAGEGTSLAWHAFDIVVDANCNISLVTVNTWLAALPAAPTYGSARSYCN